MKTPATSMGEQLSLLVKEAKKRLLLLATVFAIVSLAGLGVGLVAPKKYVSSTLLLPASGGMMKPLMDGRVVSSTFSQQTALTSELVLGRKTMRDMLLYGGWVQPAPAPQPDPREEEVMLEKLRSRIKIETPRDEMIRIAYSDSDPHRAFLIAKKLAEIYIREATTGKERESREAFEFIDKEAMDYGVKAEEAHEKVLAYYRGHDLPGAAGAASAEPAKKAPAVAAPPAVAAAGAAAPGRAEEINALRGEEAELKSQLARSRARGGAGQPDNGAQVNDQRNRVNQLQNDLTRLMGTYTNEHPDVKRVRGELDKARADLATLEHAGQQQARNDAVSSALDAEVNDAARARLEAVQHKLAALTGVARPRSRTPSSAGSAMPEGWTDPELKGVGQDATLSELLRRYEVTRDIYQDLLKRRENARVSMVLSEEQHGFSLKVQEPAELPVTPKGLSLTHYSIVGLLLGLLAPVGLLFAILKLDPRVRSPRQIEAVARVPLLVTIGYRPSSRDRARLRARLLFAFLLVAGVGAVYAATLIVKLTAAS